MIWKGGVNFIFIIWLYKENLLKVIYNIRILEE